MTFPLPLSPPAPLLQVRCALGGSLQLVECGRGDLLGVGGRGAAVWPLHRLIVLAVGRRRLAGAVSSQLKVGQREKKPRVKAAAQTEGFPRTSKNLSCDHTVAAMAADRCRDSSDSRGVLN